MKRLLFVLTIAIAVSISVKAQEEKISQLPGVTIFSKANIGAAVTAAFEQRFKDASNENWFLIEKNYLVSFTTGDYRNNALFRSNGDMAYHIKFCQQFNVPAQVQSKVNDTFGDYVITTSSNLKIGNRNVWVINLTGNNKYVIVSVENGDLTVLQSFIKAGS